LIVVEISTMVARMSLPNSSALKTIAAAALGCAAGFWLADRLSRKGRQFLALALSVGAAATAGPAIAQVIDRLIHHPQSTRASDRRLAGIRDAGLPAAADIYDGH
jgi:hypothetical protein